MPSDKELEAARIAFEKRTVPNLNLARNKDGTYKHQAAISSWCDFMDGYRAALEAARQEARFDAVVTQLVRIHDDESGQPQYAQYTHIDYKNPEMIKPLEDLARKLMKNN